MSATHKNLKFFLMIFLAVFLACSTALAQDNPRPRLGLSVSPMQASPLLLQHLRLAEGEGIMVNNVAVGGELEEAGLSQGDIILAVDGHTLEKPSDLTTYIADLPKNTKVTLDVIQKGEHRQIFVTLDNLPDEIVWKYVPPITSPGRSSLGLGKGSQGTNPPKSFNFGGSQGNATGSVHQSSTFKSMISTPQGIQSSTVTITGDQNDPSSQIEITIGDNIYKTTIGDLDKLPAEAQQAAKSAMSQSQNFSFGFSFGSGGGDIFEEMMRQQMEQMRQMDEFFRQQFEGPGVPGPGIQTVPQEDPLLPVKPGKNDIRS